MFESMDRAGLLPMTDETVPMSDETRGHAIKRRRYALGITSLREFAEASGVARQTIARAERGDPTTTEATLERLEAFLDRFGDDDSPEVPSRPNDHDERDYVVTELSGNFGVKAIVKGPITPELEAYVERIIDRLQGNRPDHSG